MTSETFNALPLEARRYIEQQKSCASCGKSNDIDRHYKNYLAMKANSLYTLRLGAVVFKDEDGEGKVLYPLHPKDSEEDVKNKLAMAVKVYALRPDKFTTFSDREIDAILSQTEEEETEEVETEEVETEEVKTEEVGTEEVETEKPVKQLFGAAKKAAEAKAAKDNLD